MENEFTALLEQAEVFARRRACVDTMDASVFEPDMMEHPELYRGEYDEETGILTLCFEAKGTRYEGRTERLEYVREAEPLSLRRDTDNAYNPNNFLLDGDREENLGTLPAELCNALAPLYDADKVQVLSCRVSCLEPITKRSRYAKRAVMFAELRLKLCR